MFDVIVAALDPDSAKSIVDPIHVPVGPITRHRARKIKDAIAGLVQHHVVRGQVGFEEDDPKIIHLTQIIEEP